MPFLELPLVARSLGMFGVTRTRNVVRGAGSPPWFPSLILLAGGSRCLFRTSKRQRLPLYDDYWGM